MARSWLRFAVVLVLVLLVASLGLPIGIGMGTMTATDGCPLCDADGIHTLAWACAAVLASLLLFLPSRGAASNLVARARSPRALSLSVLERPPRSS